MTLTQDLPPKPPSLDPGNRPPGLQGDPLWDRPAPEPSTSPRPNVAGMDRAALRALMTAWGEPAFRGDQLFEGLYLHRWDHWSAFTQLSKALRLRLERDALLQWPEIIEGLPSADGSTKYAFRLLDGKQVEGVHMPYAATLRGSELLTTPPAPSRPLLQRVTLCLSSQVGCAMGCTFCATGQMGIIRNLHAAEIVGQVITMLNAHQHPAEVPVNLVFMGMGEPLHNLDHVMAAFAVLTDPQGLAISPRRITLSTSGLVNGIDRLGTFPKRPRLALSLNATTDAYRSKIMPVNKVWGLRALAAALDRFPFQKGEQVTLEYVLLQGITDSLEDGKRLAAFARRFPAKVNLIPFNPHEGAAGSESPSAPSDSQGRGEEGSGTSNDNPPNCHQNTRPVATTFQPPPEARIEELCRLLLDEGITVSVRRSRGQDVAGACGQLVRDGIKAHRE